MKLFSPQISICFIQPCASFKPHLLIYSFRPSKSIYCLNIAKINIHHTSSLHLLPTHVDGVPLKDAELKEELQFDLPFLEQLLHLALGLVQLLQHALNVGHGAVVGSLVARDGRVSVESGQIQRS